MEVSAEETMTSDLHKEWTGLRSRHTPRSSQTRRATAQLAKLLLSSHELSVIRTLAHSTESNQRRFIWNMSIATVQKAVVSLFTHVSFYHVYKKHFIQGGRNDGIHFSENTPSNNEDKRSLITLLGVTTESKSRPLPHFHR